MKTFRKKIYALSFVLLGTLLFLSGTFLQHSVHLAPQSMFVAENIAEDVVFRDKYLQDMESLRDYLAKGDKRQIEQIISALPEGFAVHRFNSQEEIQKLLKIVVSVFDYAAGGDVERSLVFDSYTNWLESMFPAMFKNINENEMDFSTEGMLQVITLLTENVFQHGKGECILIMGSDNNDYYFSLISKGDFKSVKGAMLAKEDSEAVRGDNTVNGVALSEALGWYLSEVGDFINNYYPRKRSDIYDILISGGDGKYSYNGVMASKGYSEHKDLKRGAAATFFLGETTLPLSVEQNQDDGLMDLWNLLFDKEDMLMSAA